MGLFPLLLPHHCCWCSFELFHVCIGCLSPLFCLLVLCAGLLVCPLDQSSTIGQLPPQIPSPRKPSASRNERKVATQVTKLPLVPTVQQLDHPALASRRRPIVFSVFPRVPKWPALCVHSANTVMMSVADPLMIMYRTNVLNMLIGESLQSLLFPQVIWLYAVLPVLVRAVTTLARCSRDSPCNSICIRMSVLMFRWFHILLGATILLYQISCGHCSFLETLLQMAQFHID